MTVAKLSWSFASIPPPAATRSNQLLTTSAIELPTSSLHHLIDEEEESLPCDKGLISSKKRSIDVRDGTV